MSGVINFSSGPRSAPVLSPFPSEPIKPPGFRGPSLGMAVDVVDSQGNSIQRRSRRACSPQALAGNDVRGFWKDRAIVTSRPTGRDGLMSGLMAIGRRLMAMASGSFTVAVTTRSKWPENVFDSAEVESVLVGHPAIAEAVAISIPR